jgi:hypothetical protein
MWAGRTRAVGGANAGGGRGERCAPGMLGQGGCCLGGWRWSPAGPSGGGGGGGGGGAGQHEGATR